MTATRDNGRRLTAANANVYQCTAAAERAAILRARQTLLHRHNAQLKRLRECLGDLDNALVAVGGDLDDPVRLLERLDRAVAFKVELDRLWEHTRTAIERAAGTGRGHLRAVPRGLADPRSS